MVLLRLLLVALVALVIFDPQVALAREIEKQPTATGRGGAAATVDVLGTQAAIETLDGGGNAVDAAVAAAAVLGVTEPYSCGIGGGGFMTIRTPDGKVTTIDSREESPAAMRPDSFFENGAALAFDPRALERPVRRRARHRRGLGARAAALRDAVAGENAASRASRWHATASRSTRPSSTRPRPRWTTSTTSPRPPSSTSTRTARRATSATRSATRDLARTYRMIAREGPRAFYRGELAEAIVDAVAEPAGRADRRPRLAARPHDRGRPEELRGAARASRLTSTYRGLDVWGMGPPSSGGSTVGETLNILEGYRDLAADRTRALHLFLEASRFAFADRNAYLADPDFFDVPLAGLLSDGFAAERRALIDPVKAATKSPVAARQPLRRPGQPRPRRSATVSPPAPVDDPPRGLGPARQRRLLHVHDRVDGRQRRSSCPATASC